MSHQVNPLAGQEFLDDGDHVGDESPLGHIRRPAGAATMAALIDQKHPEGVAERFGCREKFAGASSQSV